VIGGEGGGGKEGMVEAWEKKFKERYISPN
jgi:hypothetical protein